MSNPPTWLKAPTETGLTSQVFESVPAETRKFVKRPLTPVRRVKALEKNSTKDFGLLLHAT